MARMAPKLTLSTFLNIPLDRLVLSPCNVRRIKAGASTEALAADTSVDLPWDALRRHREIDRDEVPMTEEEEARFAELEAEGEAIDREWCDAEDVPDEIHARVDAINAEHAALARRPQRFAPDDVANAGVFLSIERDGSLRIDRGYVRPEDEPADDRQEEGEEAREGGAPVEAWLRDDARAHDAGTDDDEPSAEHLKPLPDRLVSDLTAWRTLALQDAFAQHPGLSCR